MTASEIAKELLINEVTINYKASDFLIHLFRENPIPKLEFEKLGRFKVEWIEGEEGVPQEKPPAYYDDEINLLKEDDYRS